MHHHRGKSHTALATLVASACADASGAGTAPPPAPPARPAPVTANLVITPASRTHTEGESVTLLARARCAGRVSPQLVPQSAFYTIRPKGADLRLRTTSRTWGETWDAAWIARRERPRFARGAHGDALVLRAFAPTITVSRMAADTTVQDESRHSRRTGGGT